MAPVLSKLLTTPVIVRHGIWYVPEPMDGLLPHNSTVYPRPLVSETQTPPQNSKKNKKRRKKAKTSMAVMTCIFSTVPAKLLGKFSKFRHPERGAKCAMMVLEHVAHRNYLPESIAKNALVANVKQTKRFEAMTQNFFGLVCMAYAKGFDNLPVSQLGSCNDLANNTGTTLAFSLAEEFAMYLELYYSQLGAEGYFKCHIDKETIMDKQIKSFMDNTGKSMRDSGIFSAEYIYGKTQGEGKTVNEDKQVVDQEAVALEKRWVQGVPFFLCMHLDSLVKSFSRKYNHQLMFITEPQKEMLKTNPKLYKIKSKTVLPKEDDDDDDDSSGDEVIDLSKATPRRNKNDARRISDFQPAAAGIATMTSTPPSTPPTTKSAQTKSAAPRKPHNPRYRTIHPGAPGTDKNNDIAYNADLKKKFEEAMAIYRSQLRIWQRENAVELGSDNEDGSDCDEKEGYNKYFGKSGGY